MCFQVIELSMLEQGQEFELTRVNGDYEARLSLTSRYYRRRINVYSQGNGEMGVFAGISWPVAMPWYQSCNCKYLLLQKHDCSCQHRFAGANLHFRATTEKSTLQPQNRLSHFFFKTHSKFSDHEKNDLGDQNLSYFRLLLQLLVTAKHGGSCHAVKVVLLLQISCNVCSSKSKFVAAMAVCLCNSVHPLCFIFHENMGRDWILLQNWFFFF